MSRLIDLSNSLGAAITAHLMPTVNYSPQQQGILQKLLEAKNQEGLVFPDGSGRKLKLCLGNRSDIQISLKIGQGTLDLEDEHKPGNQTKSD